MKKRHSLWIPFCLSVGLPALSCSQPTAQATPEQQAPQRPNIILINIDDLGWADLSCHQSTYYQTPHIDWLYTHGIRFSNGYAAAANSAPSRACMLSGLWSPRHGVYTVDPPDRGAASDRKLLTAPNQKHLDLSFVTLPQALKEAGYTTCHIGKWHIGQNPLDQGIDTNIGGNGAGHPNAYFVPYNNPDLPDGPPGEYLMDRIADEAVHYLDTLRSSKPFFLQYATYAVHAPWQAKEALVDTYRDKPTANEAQNNPIYAAMVESMDQGVGRLLEAVRRNGYAKNTLIIFVSDNGGVYQISKQWPLRAGKGSFYEGGLRIPFIVYMEGRFQGGVTYDVPVCNLDLFPTLLDLAHAKPPYALDGKSLRPLLEHGHTRALARRALYWHFPAYLEGNPRIDVEARDPLFRTRPVSVIRKGDWKLIENYEDGVLELYNLKEDASEKHNVSADYPRKAQALYKQLNRWKKRVDAPILTQRNPAYKPR